MSPNAVTNALQTVGSFASLGAFLGAALAMLIGRADAVERWLARGSAYGGAAGIGWVLGGV